MPERFQPAALQVKRGRYPDNAMVLPAREPGRTVALLETLLAGQRIACASIWRSDDAAPVRKVNTATATLASVAGRRLVLTNDHVLGKFEEVRADDPAATFRIGNLVLDFALVRVARNHQADVAVLDLTGVPVSRIPDSPDLGHVFHGMTPWPPRIPVPGDLTFFIGFPASFRSRPAGDVVDVRTFGVSEVPVVSASKDQFLIQLDRDKWRDVMRVRDMNLGPACSGLSGAGVYVRTADGPELVGLFKEHSESLDIVRVVALGGQSSLRCFADLGIGVAG